MCSTIKMLRYLCHQSRTNHKLFKNYGNVIQKSYRNIHYNTKLCKKMYLERENSFAYDIMKEKGYVGYLLGTASSDQTFTTEQFDKMLQEDWSQKQPTQIFEAFSLLGSYSSANGLCISNKMFDSFVDILTDNISRASDEELRSLFYYLLKWPETPSIRTRNYIEVWVALDDACLNRLRDWSYDEMLLYIAHFYMLNVTRASDFTLKGLQKMASKAKQLNANQLVQVMFFVGIVRRSPFDIHNLELQLNNLFSEFNIDELAIMSMGFFKSKTPIRDMDIISKIICELIKSSTNIHEVSLAALLKIIRYSKRVATNNEIYNLLDALQHEVPRLSLMCNVHLALLGTSTLTLHEKCLTDIANFAINNIEEARMKDMERLVFTLGTFNLSTEATNRFFQKVIEELRRPERLPEIEKHGRSFACCVAFLGHLGIYPIDLMDKVLSPQFLENTYGKQVMSYGREILVIHNTAKIFLPEANMHRLSDKGAIVLAKRYTDFVPSETFIKQYNVSEKMVIDVMKTLKAFQGDDEYVVGDHIVTHHQRGDIIICNDEYGKPLKVADFFNSTQFGTLRRAPDDDNNWVALIIAGRNAIIQSTNIATGPFHAKKRELAALGYYSALVPWSEYSLLNTKDDKINYLKELIADAVKNKCKSKIKII